MPPQQEVIFKAEKYQIIDKNDMGKGRHYLVIPLEEKMKEGFAEQDKFFRDCVMENYDEICTKVKEDFSGKIGACEGFRLVVNIGAASNTSTPHVHILPVTKDEEIKPPVKGFSVVKKK